MSAGEGLCVYLEWRIAVGRSKLADAALVGALISTSVVNHTTFTLQRFGLSNISGWVRVSISRGVYTL